jgi:hypothetical protein
MPTTPSPLALLVSGTPRSGFVQHYFSVNLLYLNNVRRTQFVCTLSELFREDLSQRFAAYLARIGLPEIATTPLTTATTVT